MAKKIIGKSNNLDIKKIVGTVWGKVLLGALALFVLSFGSMKVYVSDSKFVPEVVKNANEKIVETFLGKELVEKIDEKRDSDGATTIRELFNTNKEENLVRHCEKKDEKEQEQEKCFKEYKNENLGISLEYPVDWEIYKQDTDSVLLTKSSNLEFLKESEVKYLNTDMPYTFGRVISIQKIENKNNLSLEALIEREFLTSSGAGKAKLRNNNGIEGYLVEDMGENRFGGGIGEYFIFQNSSGVNAVMLDHEMLATTKNLKLSEVFNEIVNSIKNEVN